MFHPGPRFRISILLLLTGAAGSWGKGGRSGIPEIDSLPLHDWGRPDEFLSYRSALAYSLLMPGGGQFYAGRYVRGSFLAGLEGLLLSQGILANRMLLEDRDREMRRMLDSADALYGRMIEDPEQIPTHQGARYEQIALARQAMDFKVRQQDLANSQVAWALGLHFYGVMDALELTYRSRVDDRNTRSVGTALYAGLLFPGGGQLYNRKYGKFGMLWMALASSVVSAVSRQDVVDYLERRRDVLMQERELPFLQDVGRSLHPDAQLLEIEQDLTVYRKRRNQYYWGLGLFYLYAVLDGMVDAALSDFDHSKRFALEPGSAPQSLRLTYYF